MLTGSSDYFTGVRDSLTSLALDFGRAKLIDVERASDDRNIPDEADLRAGQTGRESAGAAPGGIPVIGWVLLGFAVVAGALLIKRAL